jgi:hypothetical protein
MLLYRGSSGYSFALNAAPLILASWRIGSAEGEPS